MTVIYRDTYVLIQYLPWIRIWDRYSINSIDHLNLV